jgi:WD40-like Beta Propeller Repeat
MNPRRPLACLLMLLLAGACARRTDIIGRLPDGAVADGPSDVPPGVDANLPETGAGDVPDFPFALCPAPAQQPPVSEPVGNCGPNRWCQGQVAPALFEAASRPAPVRSPEIVYPIANSVHPTNLARITVQWKRALVEQTSFRLRFQVDAGAIYDLYVPYVMPVNPGGPIDQLDSLYTVPDGIWRYIADRSVGSVVSLTVAAHDSLANVVDVSRPVGIRFASGPVEGGLYYMTTELPGRGIQRHLFGTGHVDSLIPAGVAPYTHDCNGCHSISKDGRVLAFAATYAGNLALAKTSQLQQPVVRPEVPNGAGAFAPAVSPGGTHVVARHPVDRSVSVFRAEDGVRIATREAGFFGGRIDFPAWSPTGSELVASRVSLAGQPAMEQSARDGELVIIKFDGTNLGRPEMLLSEPGFINSYPAWSPDGQWIVFTSSLAGGETYANRQTRLRLINRVTGNVRDLGFATYGADKGSKFARFAPTGLNGCRTVFITFQSGLDYGVLRRNTPEWPQLWMSAIDLTNQTSDPSSPPVWLPFQDHEQKNLLPAWSDLIPCEAGCGFGARCDSSRVPARCVPM